MTAAPGVRHLLAAKDLADFRYFEAVSVDDMAHEAGLSWAHFTRAFTQTFGESPHQYLLTRRLERLPLYLRTTDWSVSRICFSVGLGSLGSFTTSFRRMFDETPTSYRNEGHRPRASSGSRCAWRRPTAARRTARFEKTIATSLLRLCSIDRVEEDR